MNRKISGLIFIGIILGLSFLTTMTSSSGDQVSSFAGVSQSSIITNQTTISTTVTVTSTSQTTLGQSSCAGVWILSNNTCVENPVSNKFSPTFLDNSSTTLIIPPGVSMLLASPSFASYGNLTNEGSMSSEKSFVNYGSLDNLGNLIINGSFVNQGKMVNSGQINFEGGVITNAGSIQNSGSIVIQNCFFENFQIGFNSGNITNIGTGMISGIVYSNASQVPTITISQTTTIINATSG